MPELTMADWADWDELCFEWQNGVITDDEFVDKARTMSMEVEAKQMVIDALEYNDNEGKDGFGEYHD